MVADEHDLRERGGCVRQELGQVAGTKHAGLVDDEHRPRRQSPLGTAAQLAHQRGDARALDARRVPEPARRLASHRGAAHDEPRRLLRLARAVQARTSCPSRGGPTTTCTPSPSRHSRRTMVAWSAPSVGRASTARSSATRSATPAPSAPGEHAVDHALLGCQQLDRRIARSVGDGRDGAAVAAADDIGTLHMLAGAGSERHHLNPLEERVGEGLDLVERCALPCPLRERPHDVAAIERRCLAVSPRGDRSCAATASRSASPRSGAAPRPTSSAIARRPDRAFAPGAATRAPACPASPM
jgi:hypothetical protein